MSILFENDVKMYGIQTYFGGRPCTCVFENDVKMYGIQTAIKDPSERQAFENDVKMYSIQAESVQKGIKEKVGKYR